jgi:DNA polymerase III subunit alpha
MSYDEVKEYFKHYISENKIEQMKNNTNKIADSIEIYDLSHGQIVPRIKYEERQNDIKLSTIYSLFNKNMDEEKYPYLHYFMTTENEADSYLMSLVYEGYYDKILSSSVPLEDRMDRLNYEFEQIYETSQKIEQSLSDYFITMAKMIEIIWDEADSLVGTGRGSASGFLTNYLIGITQVDPQTQSLYLPPWRFIHKDRPGLPDIDVDTESTKRVKIFNKIKQYFNEIGADVINVCTFGTEGSKSSIRTAGRSLDIDDSVVSYLTSMIPNERGFDLTLKQCYYGDDDHKPIPTFVEEMDRNPDLKKLAFAIEGLITRLGAHAAGILITELDPSTHNSIMKTSKGILVSAYNLEDSEYLGGLKYDMLTVQALDKIHATLNYMLEDRVIEWEGTLRKTYDKYLLPANLEYNDIKMWEMLWSGEIIDVFQFDTMVGSQAIKQIKPESVAELAVANSIMRLMAQEGMELPLDTFVSYKNDLAKWYREMQLYGLTHNEVKILEPYLKPLYGVADSQESVMLLTMDSQITNFSLNEANSLRKAIAKKDSKTLQETKEMFYQKGTELKTSRFLLDYVWNLQIGRQIGYSFSILHTLAYSLIALQQMNLAYKFPSIYWKTACLSVNAGAINEEDYYNLVDEGIIELSDEDDKRSQNKIQYGKVASAISDMRATIKVEMPDINLSRLGFTPNAETNSILYGIKGIARVGEKVIQDIIMGRPYSSLNDFIKKMTYVEDGTTKKLISKDRVVNLIKAGAFDRLENKPREEILKNYIHIIADQKQKLTLQNFLMLMRKNLVPDHFEEEKKCYNFTRYIRKSRTGDGYYELDEIALDYFLERFPPEKLKVRKTPTGEQKVISENWWDSIYELFMDKIRSWMKSNQNDLLRSLNEDLFSEEYTKYARGNILDWELHSLNFFYSGHPLEGVELPIQTTPINTIEEGKIIGYWEFNGKRIPRMFLYAVAGTVIDKDKVKSVVTLSTPDGVIDVKLYKQQFAKYAHESNLDEDDENYVPNEENFLEKGTHLMIIGVKRGDMFVPKTYKQTGMEAISKIILDKEGKFVEFKVKADTNGKS